MLSNLFRAVSRSFKPATLVGPQVRRSAAAPAPAELRKTPLYDLHVRSGAKMVPFAGYSMPITYDDQGLADSHHHVRNKAGLFDVSHMVQHIIKGPGALEFLHKITPSDLLTLKPTQSTLSVFLHPFTGGIVDDLMITMISPEDFFIVTNAACADKDLAYINSNLTEFSRKNEVKHTVLKNQGLIALQGPSSASILSEFFIRSMRHIDMPDLRKVNFGSTLSLGTLAYGPLLVSRGGYTGEDGFEISITPQETEAVTNELLDIGNGSGSGSGNGSGENILKLTGLGARDTLRLEAGMCLYGHDLNDDTTPIEAGLKWVVGKRRVMEGGGGGGGGNFNGAETVVRQYNDWKLVEKRRVGFVIEGAPAREGAEIIDPATEELLGKITSGCPSPTLGQNIAMGYVKSGFHKAGTELIVKVRGKPRKAVVTKMPFVPAKYFKVA